MAVLFGCALLARQPAHPDALDAHRVIGTTDFDAPAPAPAPPAMRRGMPGTVADVREGFTLYASGLHGANEEMWIPVEAVMSVWPETGTVFLAAKGDEMEHFGWNRPPASFRRTDAGHRAPKSF